MPVLLSCLSWQRRWVHWPLLSVSHMRKVLESGPYQYRRLRSRLEFRPIRGARLCGTSKKMRIDAQVLVRDGIHATGRSPSLISTTMDFCREHRRDGDGFTRMERWWRAGQ